MCTTCGCGEEHEHKHVDERDRRTVRLERDLLAENRSIASEVRRALDGLRISMFNLIGGPGAGKTALLEATIPRLRDELAIAVFEGDQATATDAQRIERTGCPVLQINTGPGCHLDAAMIQGALKATSPAPGGVVFVENVGNLVCPALFDIGERSKVVVMSVTEGDDKPLKYPHIFRAAEMFVLTKIDLSPHVTFDMDRCLSHALAINPRIRVQPVSALTGDGVEGWCNWVKAQTTS
ncbi:MAG TPA: hydrogenase nickel incorporation protein HypB [Labilithrix sp.]|jgi:hydrogenase nickel incorporation protein HypB|nr:hydrogenase nickel incorporation protein HypB [Labilithrix sp.]